MGRCFVMQPFDKGPFDQRYEDVLTPAIKNADLEPYRVDQDPAVNIPIQSIENGIQGSDVCLADITLDNPNVWFEVGYAVASQRDMVLICANERATPFPFDVQSRQRHAKGRLAEDSLGDGIRRANNLTGTPEAGVKLAPEALKELDVFGLFLGEM